MRPVGFKPAISAGERSQSCALHRAATGTSIELLPSPNFSYLLISYSLQYKFTGIIVIAGVGKCFQPEQQGNPYSCNFSGAMSLELLPGFNLVIN